MSQHESPETDVNIGDLSPSTDIGLINKRLNELRKNPRIELIGPGVKTLAKLEIVPASYAVDWHCFVVDPTLDNKEKGIKGPHIYQERNWPTNQVAFKRTMLLEFWTSADGKYQHSERTDDCSDPHYCAYRWIGSCLSLSGTPIVKSGAVAEDLREGSDRAKQLKDAVKGQRMHIVSMTESKAQNKAIREALGIEQNYDIEHIRNCVFVLMKLVFRPDMSDPAIRFLITANAIGAANAVFGGPTGAELMRHLLTAKPDRDDLLEAGRQKTLEAGAPTAAVETKPAEPSKPSTPVQASLTEEPMPFDTAPAVSLIRTLADYDALEAKCDPKAEGGNPEMIAAIEELRVKTGYTGAMSRPVSKWFPVHRTAFVKQQLPKLPKP